MKKKLQYFMLTAVIGSQLTGLVSSATFYASEVQGQTDIVTSEVASQASQVTVNSEISEVTSSEIGSQISQVVVNSEASEVDSSEVTSETSEVTSETSEVISEASEVISEASEVISEASETNTESETNSEVTGIKAEITIDEDGATTNQQAAVPTAFKTKSNLKEDEDMSTYENDLRLNANSGEATAKVQLTEKSKSLSTDLKDQPVYFVMDENGQIKQGSTKQPRSYEGNLITVLNGTIVDSDNAIARTSGGYDTTFYVYPSIEDLKSNTNGVPISGGGFDATFYSAIEEDGVYYDHIKISGYEGYTQAGNIQIVPEELIQARSYYVAEDGDWVYYSAIDPLTSTEYDRIVIDAAPAEAVAGTKYYSDDDESYYTEQLLTDVEGTDSAVTYNSYFQNLPFRSRSDYTATDFKNYLNAKGHTDSEYYNETSAFTKAQTAENINSLMIFAMANHESAYGTSKYAQACYNFFGRGAIDSDPDKACESYSYNTATDGILAQTLFLQNGYFDVLDWRYSGTHVGNKASGMNVKYASDVDWGKKISNHAYMMDQYKGGKEEDKYAIVKVSGVSHVYTDGSLATKVKSSSDSGNYSFYDLSQMTGTSDSVNVVGLQQNKNGYKIYVPTAVKKTSSQDCSFTNSMRGSYPNYGGRSKISVDTNTANYSCDYVDYDHGKYWIKKSNTSIINDKTIPTANSTYNEYYSDGKLHYKYYVNAMNDEIIKMEEYNKDGKIIAIYEYVSGTTYSEKNGNMRYKYIINPSNNTIKYQNAYQNGKQITNVYEYKSGTKYGQHEGKLRYRYCLIPETGEIKFAYGYNDKQQIIAVYEHVKGTKYGEQNGNMRYKYIINPSNNTIKYQNAYQNGSEITNVYEYKSGTKYGQHEGKLRYRYCLIPETGEIKFAYGYNDKQQIIAVYEHLDGTKYGEQNGRMRYKFIINPADNTIDYQNAYQHGSEVTNVYEYKSGTKYGDHEGKVRYRYCLVPETGEIRFAYGYDDNGKVKTVYEHIKGTKYGEQNGNMRYKFIINTADNTIKYSNAYENGKKITNVYEYQKGTKYGDHQNKVTARYCINEKDDYIKFSYIYDSQGRITNAVEYRSKTTYGQHRDRIASKYFIDPETNYLKYSYKYDSDGEIVTKYTYLPQTVYRQGHQDRIDTITNY